MARKTYSSEEVAKRMEALPEAAADFLYSSEMGSIVKSIADKHSLHIDQMGLLEAEAGQLILGLTEAGDFAPFIAESLKIGTEQATAIAKDINDQIVSKIRTSMGQPSSSAVAVHTPSTPIMKPPAPSIVMPSSIKPATPPLAVPTPTPPAASVSPAAPVSASQPTKTPNLAAADAILSEKKVTPASPASVSAAPATPAASPVPKIDPAQPQNYKGDPYREPIQ